MHSVPILIMHKMAQSTNIRIMMLSRCTMHFPVVVLYELLDECTVLIQDLVSHIRDVVKNCLIFHHEVLLRRSPGIHRWYWIHWVYYTDGNLLCCYYSWGCWEIIKVLVLIQYTCSCFWHYVILNLINSSIKLIAFIRQNEIHNTQLL